MGGLTGILIFEKPSGKSIFAADYQSRFRQIINNDLYEEDCNCFYADAISFKFGYYGTTENYPDSRAGRQTQDGCRGKCIVASPANIADLQLKTLYGGQWALDPITLWRLVSPLMM